MIAKAKPTFRPTLFVFVFSITLFGCVRGFDLNDEGNYESSSLLSSAFDGKLLYQQKCASCHGARDKSAKSGATFDRIQNALTLIPSMKGLSLLTPEIQAIADELTNTTDKTKVCDVAPDVGNVVAQRLNGIEYDKTVQDLFGIATQPSVQFSFPGDGFSGNFDNNARVLTVTTRSIEKYMAAAESIADAVFADSNLKARWFTCDLNQAACMDTTLNKIILMVFRRPAAAADVTRYQDLANIAKTEGESAEGALKHALRAALVSPHFLYRSVQLAQPANKKAVQTLNAFELATRLSYFIWSSTPDQPLLSAAQSGSLLTDAGLTTQVKRMLKDPKALSLADYFSNRWLRISEFDRHEPNKTVFPEFDANLRAAFQSETKLFLRDLFTRDGSFYDLVSSQSTFLNDQLAAHYKISGVAGGDFRKVNLAGTEYVGLLTQGLLMTANANPDRSSIVKRGKWVLENILCEAPPPPPPDVSTEIPAGSENLSMRERLVQHRKNPTCVSCHSVMDPIGFSLENFDGIGRFRTMDGAFAVDNRGDFPDGRKFVGPKGLASVLAVDKNFPKCVAEKMLTFAMGRQPETFDRCSINRLGNSMVTPTTPISALVLGIVKSETFRKQRGDGGI